MTGSRFRAIAPWPGGEREKVCVVFLKSKQLNFCLWSYLWTGIEVITTPEFRCDVFTYLVCVLTRWSDWVEPCRGCKFHFRWRTKNWVFWHCQVEGANVLSILCTLCFCPCSRPHVSELCDPLYYLKHTFVYFVSEFTQQVLPVVGISFVHWQYAPAFVFDVNRTTSHCHYIL